MLFTFSKGGWLLGIPAGFCFVFWRWQKQAGRRTWPWLVSFAVLGLMALLLAQQIPQLSERLSLRGATGVLRLNLWHSSLNMFADHPWFGVGLDNFLYNYRGRYIFNAAWEDPDLNHPHNIMLDFATRLGIFGLVSGGWLFWEAARRLKKVLYFATPAWQPLPIALGGIFAAILAHGLVDHSFFLVDLAFVFYLVLGTAVSLSENEPDK
jgi:O-antigen ligase